MKTEEVMYEWHIVNRVYLVHFYGIIKLDTITNAIDQVIRVFDAAQQPVHVILNGNESELDPHATLPRLHRVVGHMYSHPNGDRIIMIVNNLFSTSIAHTLLRLFSPNRDRGQIVRALPDALRLIRHYDPTLPPLDS